MIPDYGIPPVGRILSNGICMERVDGVDYIAIGTCEGTLSLYGLGEDLPFKTTAGLGGIAIVKIKYVSYFSKVVIIVITLETKAYFFELEGKSESWAPILTQTLIYNPSTCIIFEGKTGTEIILGTSHGGLGYYTPETNPKKNIVWKYSNNWNINTEVTSLAMANNEIVLGGRGDGNALIYLAGGNPERAVTSNLISENFSKEASYIILSLSSDNTHIAVANGLGKLHMFQISINGTSIDFIPFFEASITKSPIFIGTLLLNQSNIAVLGSSDGCLYFISQNFRNFYRHEEPIQSYFIGKLSKQVLVLVGESGYILVYSNFQLINNRIPRFLDYAKGEIDLLRSITGDNDTPDEALVSTYLYMPLP